MSANCDSDDGVRMEIAAMKGDCEKITEIYQRNPGTVNNRGEWQWTPLMRAADNGKNKAVTLLIEGCGADVDLVDINGHTALHVAATKGFVKIVELLLKHGADIDATDDIHRTALMLASANGYTEVVTCLIDNGAEIGRKSKEHQTAELMALEGGYTDIADLLKNAMAKNYRCTQQHAECVQVQHDVANLSRKVHDLSTEVVKLKITQNDQTNRRTAWPSTPSLTESLTSPDSNSSSTPLTPSSPSGAEYRPNSYSDSMIRQTILQEISKEVGQHYESLGIHLDFEKNRLDVLLAQAGNSYESAAFAMLVEWRNALPTNVSKADSVNALRKALQEVKRNDIVRKFDDLLNKEQN